MPLEKRLSVPSNPRFNLFKDKLIQALKNKSSRDDFVSICLKESAALRKEFQSLTTLKRYFTFYRNICREILCEDLLPPCLNILNLTPAESEQNNLLYSQRVADEHRALRPLKCFEHMIATAQRLLTHDSLYDRILGLAFLTGRRSAEIACSAHFEPCRENWVYFEGQLKEKNRLVPKYQIPILGSTFEIIQNTRVIRSLRPHWMNQPLVFHACGSQELSKRVKKHFSEYIDNPTVKDLRSAYAEICYFRFGLIQQTKSRFFSDILGHGPCDNLTGQSYLDFYLEQSPSKEINNA